MSLSSSSKFSGLWAGLTLAASLSASGATAQTSQTPQTAEPPPSAAVEQPRTTDPTAPKPAERKRASQKTAAVQTQTPRAAPLRPLLERLLERSHKIASAGHQLSAAESALAKSRAGWFGEVTLSTGAGHERIRNPGGVADTKEPMREAGVTLRQPLLDFGRIGGDVEKSAHARRQATATLRDVGQETLLEGLTALINVDRTRKVEAFSLQSVRNIERQSGLEESRVELGGGYATDVLQAKSQLAGANARLTRAHGATVLAENKFRTVFHESAPKIIAPLTITPGALPKSLDDAVARARASSPQLEIAGLAADIAKAEVRRVRGSELAPRVEAVADLSSKRNVSGTLGDKETQTYKVTVTMPFNLGGGQFHAVNAAEASARAAQAQLFDRRLAVDEQAANAWQNLLTAKETFAFYQNQISIAAEFLELARVERQQGRRSLIDVLSGETSLYNAQADAVAAEGDVTIAALTLLRTIGVLDFGVVK
jgi:outer membrane protein, adhesin transport system